MKKAMIAVLLFGLALGASPVTRAQVAVNSEAPGEATPTGRASNALRSAPQRPMFPSPTTEGARSRPGAAKSLVTTPDLTTGTSEKSGAGSMGDGSGKGCPKAADLRSLVDTFLATPHPAFPGLGSTTPGVSTSFTSEKCGTFTYAAGLRNIEKHQPMIPATPMLIASMTKPIIAAVTLKLNDAGAFGPRGLDTTVDRLLPAKTIKALTIGDDPGHPNCPGETYLLNRNTGGYEWTAYSCPDLSAVTLRDLMRANHGMYDIINEILLPNGASPYWEGVYFELYDYLGWGPMLPPNATNGYAYLKAIGLKRYDDATIGGNQGKDFEWTWGNTGFQLLGVILEQRTQRSLDELIKRLVVDPLGLAPIVVYTDARKRAGLIADGYEMVTGDPTIEETGLYPLVDFHGHTAVNTLDLGLGKPANIDLAGGAGALLADMTSYRMFFDAFVNGGLLGREAQRELNNSFVRIPELDSPTAIGSIGFGLIKAVYSGDLDVPDAELVSHGGYLPGTNCTNGVIRLPGHSRASATGAMCKNSSAQASPDINALFYDFMWTITEALGRPGP